jgi:UDP-N-acetylglucosamine transferase subunit ALG13
MVQKSKILGKPSIVFITIGTTSFQFNRLFKTLDEVLFESKSQMTAIIQGGKSTYIWKYKNIVTYEYLSRNKIITFINKADKVITHAGFGTLYILSQYFRLMPLVVPRLAPYKEHIDNHQLYFSQYLKYKLPLSYNKYLVLKEGALKSTIHKYLKEKSRRNVFSNYIFNKKSKNKLVKKLNIYLQNT